LVASHGKPVQVRPPDEHRPGFPTPIGLFRAWDDLPRYEDVMNQQIKDVIAKRGPGNLAELLQAGDTWEVK
jgi:hypothetical protein